MKLDMFWRIEGLMVKTNIVRLQSNIADATEALVDMRGITVGLLY
jgi:hypothetical protein